MNKNESMTPSQIVTALDKYIVGQKLAKRAVAVALRNRWRRQQVEGDLRDEISPKNIIMIGPTGVGKTEIARRLAKLARAPFVKVEASKFTEVGYVGRDVDSIVRDLIEVSVKLVKDEQAEELRPRAQEAAEEKLLDLLLPAQASSFSDKPPGGKIPEAKSSAGVIENSTREKLRTLLHKGKLDDREVEVELKEEGPGLMQLFGGNGSDMGMGGLGNLKDMLGSMGGGKTKHRKMKIPDALVALTDQEVEKLVDNDAVQREAVRRAEQGGIVFLDEIDKIAVNNERRGGDVSREGVQRDLLPIVEGSTVTTKYGPVKTDHVLFVAAGAFHVAKPSDLIPELQGRFPIRVELEALTDKDFVRILTEPKNALVIQYQALLATEDVVVEFEDSAIETLASLAAQVNASTQNIGARRLHTIMERLLDELLFSAPDIGAQNITITTEYVKERLSDLVEDEELSRYIL